MPRNKPRLYLALYARLKYPDTYHFALHVSPKEETVHMDTLEATKYHCKNIIQSIDGVVSCPWTFEAASINPNSDPHLIARILLSKIKGARHVGGEIRMVTVRQDDPTYNCVEWVRLALLQLQLAGVIEAQDWNRIHETSIAFVKKKKAEGRYDVGWGDTSKVATFNMLVNKETFG
jgi:hypothetical protein